MKILFVLPRSPWPPYVGQSRLAFYRARELTALGHDVHLFCYGNNCLDLVRANLDRLHDAYSSVTALDTPIFRYLLCLFASIFHAVLYGRPILPTAFTPYFLKKELSSLLSSRQGSYDFIHFYSIRSSLLWECAEMSSIPFCVDLVDSMVLNLARRLQTCHPLVRPLLLREYKGLRRYESSLPAFAFCEFFLVVSNLDASCLSVSSSVVRCGAPSARIFVCPIGVEAASSGQPGSRSIDNVPTITFFGSLSYGPNVDAVRWFIGKVLPLVESQISGLNFYVLGSKPSRYIRHICDEVPSVCLVSSPDSIEPFLRESFCSVAPMQSGSGQQFKILESLSAGVPVVATSLAAHPLGLDGRHLMIADSPQDFANSVVALYRDPLFAAQTARSGADYVQSNYSWSSSARKLLGLYSSTRLSGA
jgi:glycosyltransferase involved in cell wall biosynthesis